MQRALAAASALFFIPMKLKDKVVVITGASSGIGKELAFQFAGLGSKVVLAARNARALEEIAGQINSSGGSALACPTDVSKRGPVESLARAAYEKFGRLDIFIHNAGISHPDVPLTDLKEEDVRKVMETNFMGGIYSVWAAVPYLEKAGGGQLVMVTSIIGKIGVPQDSIYCASKFALQGMAQAIRAELKGKNIRVITVCPPGVDTPFFANNNRGTSRKYRLHPVGKIARMIVKACLREKREVLLTMDAKLLHYLNFFFPRFLDWAVSRFKER